MKIEYFGQSCFLMRSEGGVRFLTDPYTGVGYDMPRAEAEYVTCSHGHFDHTFVEGVGGVREVISSPGVYERGGWKLEGIPAFHDEVRGARRGKNIVFIFEADGLRLCHMGDIGEAPSARLLDAIGRRRNVDRRRGGRAGLGQSRPSGGRRRHALPRPGLHARHRPRAVAGRCGRALSEGPL